MRGGSADPMTARALIVAPARGRRGVVDRSGRLVRPGRSLLRARAAARVGLAPQRACGVPAMVPRCWLWRVAVGCVDRRVLVHVHEGRSIGALLAGAVAVRRSARRRRDSNLPGRLRPRLHSCLGGCISRGLSSPPAYRWCCFRKGLQRWTLHGSVRPFPCLARVPDACRPAELVSGDVAEQSRPAKTRRSRTERQARARA